MLNSDNLVFRSLDRFTHKSDATGDVYFVADDLQDATLTSGEEVVYGTGKQGRRISDLKKNKTAGLSFNNGFVSLGQMATQFGGSVEVANDATMVVPQVEFLTVAADSGTTAVTTFKAEGIAGAEIKVAYKANPDKTRSFRDDNKFTQGATATAAKVFAYNPTTKTITFHADSGLVEGDVILVTYNYKSKGIKISNSSEKFSKKGYGILDATVSTSCDDETVYHARYVFPKFSASGQFDLALGGDQTVHGFSGEALFNPCGGGELYSLIIPEDD